MFRSLIRRSAAALVLFGCTSVAAFAGTHYEITFTQNPNFGQDLLPTAGSFNYDTTGGFSNFLVIWDGVTFNFDNYVNDAVYTQPGGDPHCTDESNPQLIRFEILSHNVPGCTGTPNGYRWLGNSSGAFFVFFLDTTLSGDVIDFQAVGTPGPNSFTGGSFSIAAQGESGPSAPEPATWAMMVAGVVVLGGASKFRRRA